MKFKHFGNSYDVIKKALIAWFGECGVRNAHLMFTEAVTPDRSTLFARFPAEKLVSTEERTPRTNRAGYFLPCRGAGKLFLDPDTGISLKTLRDAKSINYISGPEIIDLNLTRPESLMVVFDQRYGRAEDSSRKFKRNYSSLQLMDFTALSYASHAPSPILSAKVQSVVEAHYMLLKKSDLLLFRLIRSP